MYNLMESISQANATEIEDIMKAVLQRYSALYPDWEISTISIRKESDRNEQLDSMIHTLQSMKSPQ